MVADEALPSILSYRHSHASRYVGQGSHGAAFEAVPSGSAALDREGNNVSNMHCSYSSRGGTDGKALKLPSSWVSSSSSSTSSASSTDSEDSACTRSSLSADEPAHGSRSCIGRAGGWSVDGTFTAAELSADATTLAMSNIGFVAVTLNKLPPTLTSISLAANALTCIPLSSIEPPVIQNLRALILNSNRLESIDLSPLARATSLERLWLHSNQLRAIDLAPLANCVSLRSLYLDSNRIDESSIDLSPLAKCKLLKALRLARNALGGELNITPILTCAALTTLDVSASVKLTAKIVGAPGMPIGGGSAPVHTSVGMAGLLPPALRKRAATIHWSADEDDTDDGTEEEEDGDEELDETDGDDDACDYSGVAPAATLETDLEERWGSSSAALVCTPTSETESEPSPLVSPVSDGRISPASRVLTSPSDPSQLQARLPPLGAHQAASTTPSVLACPGLEELFELSRQPCAPGRYLACLVGFRHASRFGVEALLGDQGGLLCAVVANLDASVAANIAQAGALQSCSVFLVRPDAESFIVELREMDQSIPIVVVGNCTEAAEAASRCLRKGASCFLTEPLSQRDALAVRGLAQQRARAMILAQRALAQQARKEASSCSIAKTSAPSVHDSSKSAAGYDTCRPPTPMRLSLPVSNSSPSSQPQSLAAGRPNPAATTSPGKPKRGSSRSKTAGGLTKRMSTSRSTSRPRSVIDFQRIRARVNGITSSKSNRVEDSAISMMFARCGGRAFPSDFSSIATLCGLPTCAAPALHAAAKAWAVIAADGKPATPAVSPMSVMGFASASERSDRPGRHEAVREGMQGTSSALGRGPLAPSGSSAVSASTAKPGISGCRLTEMVDVAEEQARQAEGVSYDVFRMLWEEHMRNRDCETRLFNVLRLAYKCENVVPIAAIRELGKGVVSSRATDIDPAQLRNLAASILCYELKGSSWHWVSRHELRQARLCGSLLAAESGMYNGVAAHLRLDRLADVRTAFTAASGKRAPGSCNLSVKDLIWINAERGLLTPRAVEALYARVVPEGQDMDLATFGPMWLATNNIGSRSACEYLFDILDVDRNGYINAEDAAHFYADKRRILERDGYAAIAFEHVWRGLLDAVAGTSVPSSTADYQVSLTDLRQIGERDWTNLFQSLLFADDELAMVNLSETSKTGSLSVAATAALS